MATITTNGDTPTDSGVALQNGAERTNGFTAVNGEAEGSATHRTRSEERANTGPPPARTHAPKRTYTVGDMEFKAGGNRLDRMPNDTPSYTPMGRSPYGSPPPTKRKRTEEPHVLTVRTTMTEDNDSRVVIKTSPESQAREVIHLVTPEQAAPPSNETSKAQHSKAHDSTSVPRTSDRAPWNPEHVRPETVSDLQASFTAYSNSTRPPAPEIHEIESGSDDDQGAGVNPDGSRRTKRQFSHRTKSGCYTCRKRKKKCDEGKPYCQNCLKGKFHCQGYGIKPVGDTQDLRRVGPGVYPHQIQARPEYGPPGSRPPMMPEHWQGGPYYPPEPSRHAQYGAPQPPPGTYGTPTHDVRDPWARPYNDAAHIHLQGNKLGPVDYAPVSVREYQPKDGRPPGGPQDPYMPHLQQRGPHQYSMPFGRESTHMSHDRRGSHLPPMMAERVESERDKMLIGAPYRHWKDGKLIADRLDCKTAVDLYNRAALPSEALSQDERANRFTAILNPSKRISAHGDAASLGRVGRCGERTIVEAPFYCDYGYNLIIGAETVIYPNCYIQDPAEIIIGNRCIIGPNVKLYGMTASIDMKSRAGSQGNYLGGSIQIEDDVWIGGDVTILPYRIIGKGAVIGAGSVVTRNVKPYTIVAGNPAKEVRSLNDQTADRRMRTEIQQENEHMIEEMKRRRYLTGSESSQSSRTLER